ncbi:phage holin family protein [Streptomyces sp. NRRL S-1868]|uniref:phage holin family protein n=1 Tax=Streptomyces sp. NRRL S-1868 TaxID=1463892 RepID=UPI00099C9321|nr:phage holin family protein [Streptomyces sp. NRRL S-1868]
MHGVTRIPWRRLGAGALRVGAVWLVTTVTMLVLAGLLPEFRLQSADGDSATVIGITAAAGAGAFGLLSALVWPVLVRAFLLVPAIVLGTLVFFLNGSLLWLALYLIPYDRGSTDPTTAVVVATVMSAASSATNALLAVRDDRAYRHRLARIAGRRRRREGGARPPCTPGTVFLQLDGLGHAVLAEALRTPEGGRPLMPAVAALCGRTHCLTPWRTDWSSQTGASQLGILHGSNADVPAFRWYEKSRGEVIVSNRPTSAAELQRRAVERTGDRGLLAQDGASRGNLFTGGAKQVALVLSVSARRRKENRSRAGYFAYFSDPANATRTAVSFVAEVVREIVQSTRARLRRERPRVGRGGLYPFVRAFATVVERDVVVAAVLGDMLSGRTAVYADLVGYDEVAHHSGPRGRDTRQVLRRLDRAVGLIVKVAEHAPRPYRIVLLSDHGQSAGETFEDAYGLTLEELVRAGSGLRVPRRAGRRTAVGPAAGSRSPSGAEARASARAALRRPEESGQEPPRRPRRNAGPVVLASGNLGLVSFPDMPGRVTREQLEARRPALLRTLAEHPGVGFVLVHSEEHGPVVLGAGESEHRLETGEIVGGRDPLAPFGPGAAAAVLRTARFTEVPDLMVNSSVDPDTGAVHAFEEQIGSHGGLGGEQNRAFLLSPLELSPPVRPDEELVGAEAVHRVLRRWLAENAGYSVYGDGGGGGVGDGADGADGAGGADGARTVGATGLPPVAGPARCTAAR